MGGSVGQRNRADSNDVPKGLDEEVFGVDGHHREGVEAVSAGSCADADAGAQGTELRRERRSPGNTDRESLSVAETRDKGGGNVENTLHAGKGSVVTAKRWVARSGRQRDGCCSGTGDLGELHCVS